MIGMTVIPSATGNTKRQIEMIRDFGVTVIHCTPSYAMHLSEVAEEMDESLDGLKTGIFGAEPLSESVRKTLEKRLGITAFNSYGLSEFFGPGWHSNARNATGSISGMISIWLRSLIRFPENTSLTGNGGSWS